MEMPIFGTLQATNLMEEKINKEGKFSYIEIGEGKPIIILHGLMGGLSNFHGVTSFFPPKSRAPCF